jgi:hypothetical protein
LSYDILEWLLRAQLAGRPFLLHSYPLNQFDGAQSGLPDFNDALLARGSMPRDVLDRVMAGWTDAQADAIAKPVR